MSHFASTMDWYGVGFESLWQNIVVSFTSDSNPNTSKVWDKTIYVGEYVVHKHKYLGVK
jgi:hypothetical protein